MSKVYFRHKSVKYIPVCVTLKKITITTYINKPEFLYFLSYGIYLIYTLLTTTFFYAFFYQEIIYKCLILTCMFILALKEIVFKRLSNLELIGLIICMALSLILLRRMVGQFSLLPFFLYIYCSRDIPFEKIARFSYWLLGILLMGVVVSAYIGIIPNYLDTLIPGRDRYYLGFTYALDSSIVVLNIMSLSLYLHRHHISLIRCLLWFVIIFWFYLQTRSRLAFLMGILILALFYLVTKFPGILRRKWLNWGMAASFIICSTGGIFLTVMYEPTVLWMKKLNNILENRLALGKNALELYGYKLLGMRIQYVGNGLDISGERKTGEYNYVDCLYVSMLQKYGVLFLICFIMILTIAMFRMYKKNKYYLLIIMTSIALRGLIDNTFFPLYFNTFWLAIGPEVFRKHENIV